MQTIVLASQKGGAGKTTLARHLAVEAQRKGFGPVALIDADPQGGLSGWWNRRENELPVFIQSGLDDLHLNLKKLQKADFKLTVIDTPPAVTGLIRSVVSLADLVVIPARPSPDDLDAIGATIDIVEEVGKPLIFVINGATRKARLTGSAAITLSQHGRVASQIIHHSVAFPTSAIAGLTVQEVEPGGNPAIEISELWGYLAKILTGKESKQEIKKASKEAV